MPRGGVLNEPTMDMGSGTEPPKLPPPRRTRRSETTATVTQKKKSGFLPFLVAVLFVAGLLAGIGYQGLPWLMPGTRHDSPRTEQQPPQSQPQQPQAQVPPVIPPIEEKPSPVGPVQPPPTETKPAEEVPKRAMEEPPRQDPKTTVPQSPARQAATAQVVMVVSSPGGATAILDGNPAITCTTPCTLPSPPGRHTVSLVLPGHEIERREIIVGGGPMEMPPVMLRAAGGTLMLSSVPPGATVAVDGKKLDMVTPAQVPLALGAHSITVEKDGKSTTETVDIKNGINFRRIAFGQ
jgi:hypothetical protein